MGYCPTPPILMYKTSSTGSNNPHTSKHVQGREAMYSAEVGGLAPFPQLPHNRGWGRVTSCRYDPARRVVPRYGNPLSSRRFKLFSVIIHVFALRLIRSTTATSGRATSSIIYLVSLLTVLDLLHFISITAESTTKLGPSLQRHSN